MKAGAKLQTQDNFFGEAEEREAVLAGLIKTDAGFEKMDQPKSFAIPLRRNGKKKDAAKTETVAPTPAPAPPVQPVTVGMINNDDDYENDDDLIDEDTLLSDEDLKRPIQRKSNS